MILRLLPVELLQALLCCLQPLQLLLHIGEEGNTIQDELKDLLVSVAEDVTACTAICDAIGQSARGRGRPWDDTLQDFIRRFCRHRAGIELALAQHLGEGVDVARRNLATADWKYVAHHRRRVPVFTDANMA